MSEAFYALQGSGLEGGYRRMAVVVSVRRTAAYAVGRAELTRGRQRYHTWLSTKSPCLKDEEGVTVYARSEKVWEGVGVG